MARGPEELKKEEIEMPRIRQVLKIQNRGLRVEEWRHADSRGRPDGVVCHVVCVSEGSDLPGGMARRYELVTLTMDKSYK